MQKEKQINIILKSWLETNQVKAGHLQVIIILRVFTWELAPKEQRSKRKTKQNYNYP